MGTWTNEYVGERSQSIVIAHLQIDAQEISVLDSREIWNCDCKMRTAEIEL